ncbi:MAG TPA: PA14 domain-containing protein [Sedimentisphaerales bacterium]|nr:PA14 domain-containing protein [Sedimentisphaerales bacterium]
MCKKLIYLAFFVLVLGLVSNTNGQPTGEFLLEWWFDIGAGNAVTDLINNPNYPDNPTGSAMVDSVELPTTKPASLWEGDVDNYGARLQGYIYPPATGDYTFWITGDNGSQFWLSTNFDSSNVVMMCEVPGTQWTGDREWDKFPDDQESTPVTLEAGQKYYVDVWFKEGSGGDGVAVGWEGPEIGEGPEVISGQYISPVTGPTNFIATDPSPSNGAVLADTWVSLSWDPGAYAVSHNVYFADNFDDVDADAESAFRGNQPSTYYVVGFPGFPYPDGLTIGTTYYWRVDEVNDTNPESPWKGNIWSFMIPPKKAYGPSPADSAELVDPNVELSWETGFGSKLHYMYFGDNFDEVKNATGGAPLGFTTYTPGPLKLAKTYYWRVDEFDILATHKGDVWSFTTQGGVVGPNPANGAVDVKQTPILTWSPGVYSASHQVYFGTYKEVVRNANTGSPEYKGAGNLGSESSEPGKLEWNTTYYWRIDEINNANPDSPWVGPVWSFTTANFLIVDDFEPYNDLDPADPESNRIFNAWLDGYDDPTNGSLVGYENPPFAEQTIVHGGNQSMPLYYDNSVGYSEATLTLIYPRDWTENGVSTLTIWFRGNSANAAETLYVALNGNAIVTNDNPDAAQITAWTEWTIDLQAFGVNLANVNTIALGLGNKNNPQAGGSGTMYFDDIRLYAPAP